ncbi:YggS family pyridoxal phosphate-dependent enzyme [Bacillus carboniphilus]|uniref:Pyridoxal phosphate homeostasis protein n=1 Tax=Bacillus carboniphilus TaxID=86663 RepID=A0ABY9JXV3_9BACI|nr:YggS family pyridoxal phosphate-dependent enzyme [Bacillus carboniphilus]WLR43613.1 YggS family pyridoxal phosphate-dependent enzyme [Bacillus carboniphilus]
MSVEKNLSQLKKEIEDTCSKMGRSIHDINIIAVTKYVSKETAKEAVDLGVTHLGENRVEGLHEKYENLGKEVTWHFIGTLQSRKVKDVLPYVDYIHSLDRLSLAKEINKRSTKKVPCFVQVNTSGEESKHGLKPEDVVPFIRELEAFSKIKIVGLMTMAPYTDDEKRIRSCFQMLTSLKNEVQQLHLPYAPCEELSMGMSNDFQIAIEEGATMIRIGSSLVGNERKE